MSTGANLMNVGVSVVIDIRKTKTGWKKCTAVINWMVGLAYVTQEPMTRRQGGLGFKLLSSLVIG